MGMSPKLPWSARVRHLVGLAILLGLLGLAVYGRCRQMEHHVGELVDRGFEELARVIGTPDADYSSAKAAFQVAAGAGLGGSYPLFCHDALEELEGDPPSLGDPPVGWQEAVDLLGNVRLPEARQRFSELEQAGGPYAARAHYYQRFIDDLERQLQ